MKTRLAGALACLAMASTFGCAFFYPAGDHEAVRFDAKPDPHGADPFANWQAPPLVRYEALKELEEGLSNASGVRSSGESVGGTTGVEKIVIDFDRADSGELTLKTKRAPGRLDGINNAPRKELASYAIQKLFLDPEDYVVPTTSVHCARLEEWRTRHPSAKAQLDGSDCVILVVAVWLKDVTLPNPLYDEARFLSDPSYAYFLSNFNLLTYLVDHRDGRTGNFLVSKDNEHRGVFAVDNGSTFGPLGWNYFVKNWNVIRVAAVRKASVDRLRGLERADLDFLLVVSQLELDENGVFELARPGPPLDASRGAMRKNDVVQFGLTQREVDAVWDRIQALIAAVDDGSLPVF